MKIKSILASLASATAALSLAAAANIATAPAAQAAYGYARVFNTAASNCKVILTHYKSGTRLTISPNRSGTLTGALIGLKTTAGCSGWTNFGQRVTSIDVPVDGPTSVTVIYGGRY